jgi:hypothetical protein
MQLHTKFWWGASLGRLRPRLTMTDLSQTKTSPKYARLARYLQNILENRVEAFSKIPNRIWAAFLDALTAQKRLLLCSTIP